ncbi:MAG: HD-GYP domain-containing protein [Candidatus Omnitrophota bacterium]
MPGKYKSSSHDFKITAVILLFTLTGVRLLLRQYFPVNEIIPDKIFLLIILVILFYLWIQELLDFHKLVKMNDALERAHEQLKNAEIDTIGALIRTEEAKDLYTRGHSERVTSIALDIANELKVNDEQKNIINRASILHDIGKIGLSDAILNKKEKLTEEEFESIKKHPENAAAILEPLKFLSAEREIIVQHHERYDGKGYPRGLKAGGIRFEAMIISVADAFDAMNSKRAYRDALNSEVILEELKKGSGTQHSPEVTEAFLRLLEKNPGLREK